MKTLIAGNWKMNPATLAAAEELFISIKNGVKDIENACPERSRRVETAIFPPFIYLSHFLNPKSYLLNPQIGAQNCFWEDSGAYTGEVSPSQVSDMGCAYVIIGHSERRQYFNETDEIANKKIRAAFRAGIRPILCIGETGEEKEEGKTSSILTRQLKKALAGLSSEEINTLTVAYEPIWAIGTGNPCGTDEAKKTGLAIRDIMAEQFGRENIKNVRVLYGGSVNSNNAVSYIKDARMNGFLIGGVSLKPQEFIKIIRDISNI